jgi:hypothetical protein
MIPKSGNGFSAKIMRQNKIMRIAAVVVLVAWITTPATASASTEEVFRAFDLFGSWSDDCAQPASPEHPRVSILIPSPGLVIETHELGAEYETNRYRVLSAERISATRLSVEVIFRPDTPKEERQKLEFLIRNGTRRTMFNQPQGGPVRVKNGIAVAVGLKTPVMTKCE